MMDVYDGCLFANHPVFQRNEKALQIIGYYDEVTLINPIGSRAKKRDRYAYFAVIFCMNK